MLEYLITFLLFSAMLIFFTLQYFKLKNDLHKQNVKAISLYLDKKFINKLLLLLLNTSQLERIQHGLQYLIDEIIAYFCLDFLAIRLEHEDTILTFKSHANKNYYTENELNKLLIASDKIREDVGSLMVKEDSYKEFIVFKHNRLLLLAVLESKHTLSSEEKDTLGNEIMCMIKIAIFATLNMDTRLRNFA